MNLIPDLPNRCRQHPRKALANLACGTLPEGGATDMGRTRSVHPQPKQQGPAKEEAQTLLNLHKQYRRLSYSCIAKRLGVDASYINRVANGEHQPEKLRRALLSELGLIQAAA